MNTSELVNRVAVETGYSDKIVSAILDSMTTVIGNTLIEGNEVRLNAFGTFKNQEWKGRTVMNIQTGEYMKTRTTHRVKFVPSVELKEAVR